jgi:methyl-accepting chemotaxis protein
MDSTALQELIAQVRGTVTELAATEQRVASFTVELARGAEQDAKPANRTPIAKRGSSGWVPAG